MRRYIVVCIAKITHIKHISKFSASAQVYCKYYDDDCSGKKYKDIFDKNSYF